MVQHPTPTLTPTPSAATESSTTTSTTGPTTAATTTEPSASRESTPPSTTPSPATTENRSSAAPDPTSAAAATPATPNKPAEIAPTEVTEPSVTATPSDPEPASSSVSQEAQSTETAIPALAPETLEAPRADIALAKSAKPIEEAPAPAPAKDVQKIAGIIDVKAFRDDARRATDVFGVNREWDRTVRQWDQNWVEYDDYYRPIINNPYRQPVKIVYVYQNAPRIAVIPALASIVLEAADFAAYSFTALVTDPINQLVNVAVGSFFGGGYLPRIGLPLPPPPRPVLRYDDIPVQVRYSQQVYEPFRVQRIIDVGDDARYGERKVLLDGVTPAWGEWTQTSAGERQFEVHRTQQFPGLDEPREAPLPGDYPLQLLTDESPSSGFTRRDVYMLAAAGLCALLSFGAIAWTLAIGRRRRV